MAEKRSFKMHEKLLLDVIMRQAGTLQKAVLEGVMNSIEAGASSVNITIEPRRVVIQDDGKGFQSRQDIELFFETFGQPHEASENKKWAAFRMGRGQIFAFGKNVWQTGQFAMRVDIKTSIDYDLDDHISPPFKGCKVEVELYDFLNDRDIYSVITEAARQVKYVSIPVVINGKQVNIPPENETWSKRESDENAFIRLNASSSRLEVYNMGIFVTDIPKYVHGVAGVVVSKKRLEVNFARNEVIKSCPVWQRIQSKIEKSSAVKKVKTKRVLSDDERFNMIGRLCAGSLEYDSATKAQLFVDVQGHAWSVSRILKADFSCWTVAKRGDHVGEGLLHRHLALVLDEENAELFTAAGCKVSEIFSRDWTFPNGMGHKYTSNLTGWRQGLKFVPFKELAKNVNDRDDIIPKEKWRKSEFVWSRVISSMAWNIRIPDREGEQTPRKIMIGTSNRAAAWTDGETFIAFDRKFLAGLPLMKYDRPVIWSLIRVGQTLFHEICHDGEADDMYHSPEFYKLYHDMSKGGGGLVGLADIVAKACAYLTPAKYADLLKQAKGDEPETAEPVESEAVQAAALAKVEPKAKKGQGVAATVGGGRTAKEVVDPAEIERIWQARQGGMSFEKIEGEFGLRNANGMTAYRICKKRRATVAAV